MNDIGEGVHPPQFVHDRVPLTRPQLWRLGIESGAAIGGLVPLATQLLAHPIISQIYDSPQQIVAAAIIATTGTILTVRDLARRQRRHTMVVDPNTPVEEVHKLGVLHGGPNRDMGVKLAKLKK